jgi:hypothetical protein
MANYSTPEAARKCGIHHITLQRWVSEMRFKAPKLQRIGSIAVRLWTDRDIERVKKYKAAQYCKGRGRKPKPKR